MWLFLRLIFFVTGAGAKGKFSGGFDITAFGGIQGGKSMCDVFYVVDS